MRKMLIAMCNDLRVVFLKLASRLQTLRYMVADPTVLGSSERTRLLSMRRSPTVSVSGR